MQQRELLSAWPTGQSIRQRKRFQRRKCREKKEQQCKRGQICSALKRTSRGKERERSRREQKIVVNQLLPSCHHSDGRWERLQERGASKNEFSTKWYSVEKTEEKATHFRKLKKMQHFVRFQI